MKLVRLKTATPAHDDTPFTGRSLKQTADWIESLSRGNPEACADTLRGALNLLNRSVLKRAARFDQLELLRPVVNDACVGLVARYKASGLPLAESQQQLADQVLGLYAQLATGYKIAVNEQVEAWEAGRRHALALQLAIQRALLALGRVLLESYRIYAPEPPHLWRDVHTLYRNAELAKLQALPVEGTRDAEETALSIKQAYLRTTVLALTNPYHLMQGEAEELYRRIGRWVHFVQLQAPTSDAALAGHFGVDLGSDFPPRYYPRGVAQPPSTAPRLLNVDQLIDTLDHQIQVSNESLAQSRSAAALSSRLQRDMYIRFRDALAGRGERRSERRSTIARLVMVEGLSGCHFFLNGRQPFAPEKTESSWSSRLEQGGGSDGLSLIGDDEPFTHPRAEGDRTSHFKAYDYEADDAWNRAQRAGGAHTAEKRKRRVPYQAHSWHRKNESEGGLALFCAQWCPTQSRVGELVAYCDQDTPNADEWRIGTVRWLRTRPSRGLELGIKRLAKNGHAVGIKALTGAGKGSEYLRGILIPRVNPLTDQATLIAPAAVYDVGSLVRLSLDELVLHARLTELLETTRQFSHFGFKLVEAPVDFGQ